MISIVGSFVHKRIIEIRVFYALSCSLYIAQNKHTDTKHILIISWRLIF